MLIESIRKHSGSWWFRTFLFILAVTFGVLWYGQDVLTGTRGGVSNLASVGGTKINLHQFSQSLSQELSHLQGISKTIIPPEQQQKLYPHVLENLVTNLLFQRETERLGLVIPDEAVRRAITQDQGFKKEDGSFDRDRFNAFLQNTGMRESTFVETLRRDTLIRELVQTLFSGITVPQSLLSRMYSYDNQRRVLDIVSIESAKVPLEKDPSDNEILDYFKKNPAKFVAQEYRDISVIVLTPSLIKQETPLTDSQLQQAYQTRIDEFNGKTLDQVKEQLKESLEKQGASEKLFELSNKIDDAMAGGASLEEISKTYNAPIKTFSWMGKDGFFASKDANSLPLSDPLEIRIVTEAFGEKEGESTKIIETGDGNFFLARVDKVYSAHPMTFDESKEKAKNLLIQHLKSQKAKEIVLDIEHQVNREGLFSMIAQQKGLRISQIRVSRKGPLAPIAFYLPENFIEALYHIRVGGAKAASYINDHNQRDFIVGSVVKVEPVQMQGADEKIKEFKDQLKQEIFNDLLVQYISSLRKIFPVEYNNKAIERLLRSPS